MSENANLTEYYKDLLIIQYNDKTKARDTIGLLVGNEMIYDLAVAVRDGFDIDTAIGAQLDILGKYIGSDRIVTGTEFTRDYFGYAAYNDTTFVFKSYTTYPTFVPNGSYFGGRRYACTGCNYYPLRLYGAGSSSVQSARYRTFGGTYQRNVPDVQFFSYRNSTGSLFELNDEEFRQVLKLLIIKNYSSGSAKEIDNILANTGLNVIFTDRQNMSISFIFPETSRRFVTIAKSEDLLPRPSGVGMSVAFTPYIGSIFSYSRYGGGKATFAVGYAQYGHTPVGGMIGYGE